MSGLESVQLAGFGSSLEQHVRGRSSYMLLNYPHRPAINTVARSNAKGSRYIQNTVCMLTEYTL